MGYFTDNGIKYYTPPSYPLHPRTCDLFAITDVLVQTACYSRSCARTRSIAYALMYSRYATYPGDVIANVHAGLILSKVIMQLLSS